MADMADTAEARAREIVEGFFDLPPKAEDSFVAVDVGTVAGPIADALKEAEQRGYERGLEEAAEVAAKEAKRNEARAEAGRKNHAYADHHESMARAASCLVIEDAIRALKPIT